MHVYTYMYIYIYFFPIRIHVYRKQKLSFYRVQPLRFGIAAYPGLFLLQKGSYVPGSEQGRWWVLIQGTLSQQPEGYHLGGVSKYFVFSSLPGEMIQFD